MLQKMKWYLIEIASKKYVPVGVMAGMTTLVSLYMAHQGTLEQYGVNYIAQWSADWLNSHPISGPVLLIELDTMNQAIIALVVSLIAMAARAGQHHVTGNGAMDGGRRDSDPPVAA